MILNLFAFCVLCVLCGCVVVGFADVVEDLEQSTRDLTCHCGRRVMRGVMCDAARARTIVRMLSRNCPWCSNNIGPRPDCQSVERQRHGDVPGGLGHA